MKHSVADYFLDRFEKDPDAEAVRAAKVWSYADLAGLSGAVANYLIEAGLERGDRVAMVVPNCAEYIAIYFGIAMAGGAIVPLNALDKPRTLLRQAEHCAARFLFHDAERTDVAEYLDQHSSLGRQIHRVRVERQSGIEPGAGEAWHNIIARSSSLSSLSPRRAADVGAILYTSGTTGRPKGVTLSHGNLIGNMQSILGFLPVRSGDRCLVVLPFYHSFGNSVLTTHLSSGACLVLQDNIAFPKRVLERMAAERIDSLYGVPLTFAILFGKGAAAGCDLPSLRYVAQAGGAMYKPQVVELREALPRIDIYVMYGQTEATARLSYVPASRLSEKLGSAGRAIPNVEIAIRDPDGRPSEAGATGDIWVRGPNVMMGYWDNPEETAEVLRDGWLWTRDRGRLDEEGFLYIEGRSSDMIKSGANRVSPDEIEEVITMMNEVKAVGVAAVPDEVLGQAIAAFVVPHGEITAQEVKAFCLKSLPPYKIPKQVVIVDRLPRTETGKVQRQKLLALLSQRKDDPDEQ